MKASFSYAALRLALAAAFLLPLAGRADDAPAALRRRTLFDAGWRFQRGDPAGAADALAYAKIKDAVIASSADFLTGAVVPLPPEVGQDVPCAKRDFDDGGWRQLNLPHDWAIEGPFDINLPGATGKLPWTGAGWYRKRFQTPATLASGPGRRLYLDIDGAMAYAAVWCNGRFVGGWPYGYSSFRLDLTPYLDAGGENVLAVRLDNPPASSRWYPGSGLYRHVWLVETPAVHFAHWGTQVTTPGADSNAASVQVKTTVENLGGAVNAAAKTEIFACGPDGHAAGLPVAVVPAMPVSLKAAERQTLEVSTRVPGPKLWDTAHPNLYAAVTTLLADNRAVDREETVFGIRTFGFSASNGFYLNNRTVKLHGVCGHHDLGALGVAFNAQAMERQLTMLKAMGCNALRTSHNPPAPELLDLCDRLGILVMDEAFDCWQTGKNDHDYHVLFDDWAEKDLRALVRRDRNHPSVILWSIGNEVPDQSTPQGPDLAKKLTGIAHAEDDTRLTTTACDKVASGYNDFCYGVDVFGYNYKPDQYARFIGKHPDQPLLGSETSSGYSSRGAYFFPVTEDPNAGRQDDQVSSYDYAYSSWATGPEREFKGEDENPAVAGEFVWTGFDYLGEPTPYGDDFQGPSAAGRPGLPARSSYFGILDLAGFPKDRFYLYQARWRPELPMAHLLPHWTWPGREGQVTPVHLYTSGDEAELFLNGQSLGRRHKIPGEYRLRWDDVQYAPGELRAVAYRNGQEWATDAVRTAGPAARLLLRAEPGPPHADGAANLSFVDADLADARGVPAPDADNKIRFSITGPAEIAATDNGDATDLTAFPSAERRAFHGKCLAILRARPGAAGPVTLRAEADGLPAAELRLEP